MRLSRAIVVLILVLVSCVSFAQNIDSIRYVLDSTYAQSSFFGNVLITQNGKTIFEKSYGYADAVNKKPLTADNSFQVASISKQFTAYGIMLLKDKGLLSYDSLVVKYLPSFPYHNITIRHLLTHTSGLPDFWDGIRPYIDTAKANGNKEMLDYLIAHKLPLQSEPGTKFTYADIGYDLLANIIEQVSGQSYTDFIGGHIFKPLKMRNSFAYVVTDIRRIDNKHLAIGHVYNNGKFEYAHLSPKYHFVYYLGGLYGDGSVVTTARDLAIWDRALKNCTLLPCAVQNESIMPATYNGQPVPLGGSTEIGYGFGWFLKSSPALGKMIYHSGGHPGNVHVMYRLPDKDICFIFLSNAETANLKPLRNRILQLL